jgi:Tfp pilus assembly protein PilF
MAPEPRPPSSPPVQRLLSRLSWLGIFLLLLLAGQGCGTSQFERSIDKGVEADRRHDNDLAIVEFSEAIRLKPDVDWVYYDRANAYTDKGDYDRAIANYNEVIRLDPDFVSAYTKRGLAYDNNGKYDKAIADENEAIRLKLKNVEAYNNRGLAYYHQGDYDRAVADYSEAILLDPYYEFPYNNLAWLLAVCPDAHVRNGAKAVDYATKACELSEWRIPGWIHTLAAAYAEVGDFDNAVKWETKYLESALSKEASEKAHQQLSLYEQKKPYHEEEQ